MKVTDPNAYYADRPVEHTAQGDIHAGIPFVQATWAEPAFAASGARKRPGGPDPEHATTVAFTGLGVTADATRILNAAIIQTYTPNDFELETLAIPDMTDGWATS